jgi:actin-like ATPase involved in cell morphogenesis
MTASQSLQIYEILQTYFKNAEDARKVVKAIEEVVESKMEAQSKDFENIVNKDVSNLIGEIKENMAKMKGELSTSIAESKADIIKWMFIFWAGQLAAMFAFLKFFK